MEIDSSVCIVTGASSGIGATRLACCAVWAHGWCSPHPGPSDSRCWLRNYPARSPSARTSPSRRRSSASSHGPSIPKAERPPECFARRDVRPCLRWAGW